MARMRFVQKEKSSGHTLSIKENKYIDKYKKRHLHFKIVSYIAIIEALIIILRIIHGK